ncbi:protein obstructor-E-like [Centruroides vittatus]|uniref:protein obstructor-E-like n=1 Tax=Centruroides vittatus TaxID=120091 RepID=UPI003510CD80
MKWFVWITLCFGYALAIQCPPENGFFPHETQCDKYYECDGGYAKERLCPDGLVFNEKGKTSVHCESPYAVDCSTRPELQPAKENDECPRKNGLFPDKDDCASFWNCVDGKGTKSSCPHPLVFSIKRGTCDWPKNVDDCEAAEEKESKDSACLRRFGTFPDPKDCRAFWTCVDGTGRRSLCPDGLGFNPKRGSCDWADSLPDCDLGKYYDFKCPEDLELTQGDHAYFPFPNDCRKHFACIRGNGDKSLLRLLTCDVGLVYDDETERCTVPSKVQGCEDYYKSDTSTEVPKRKYKKKEVETST